MSSPDISAIGDLGVARPSSPRSPGDEWILPGLRYVELKTDLAGARDIEVSLPLQRRSVLAEAYRKEVFDIYREDRLTEEDYLRAVTAAQRAVEDDRTLDNYLLAIRASRLALFDGGLEHPTLVTSLRDLNAMAGFSDLGFAQRWRVQSDLLEMLASAPDPEALAFFGQDYRSAAIGVAETMVGQLTPDMLDLADLPATSVLNTLTQMHGDNGDCPSILQTASRAVELAPALRMNWASQRRFLNDWGDCLERMSGIGNGRTAEDFIAQTRANTTLSDLWGAYAAALKPSEVNFLFPANTVDERLKALADRARIISEGT